jgi:pimeloyl-ACP methyl ester carboxylesterase
MRNLLLGPALFGGLIGGAFVLAPLREHLTPRAFAGDNQFVQAGGYELHYTDEGPRDGPPVVMLHGFAAWAFTWRAQRKALAEAGYRVITIDQIGYGGSSRPEAPVYTTRTQAELMLHVMDALGVGGAHIVGHSFGARVGMQMAIIAPERVRSLVAIAPEAFATERPPIAAWVKAPLFGYAFAFYSTAPALVGTGLKIVTKIHSWITDEVIAGYAAPLYVQGSAAAQVWQARSPKDGAQPPPANLAAIIQPTLLIWGGDDPVFPASDGHKLAGILPNARLTIFHGAGHLPHEEARDPTTEAMLGFLGNRE